MLGYRDVPGARTSPHRHPDSAMLTLSGLRRRPSVDEGPSRDVRLAAGEVRWLGARSHVGQNIGDTPTHVVFGGLKERGPGPVPGVLGPEGPS